MYISLTRRCDRSIPRPDRPNRGRPIPDERKKEIRVEARVLCPAACVSRRLQHRASGVTTGVVVPITSSLASCFASCSHRLTPATPTRTLFSPSHTDRRLLDRGVAACLLGGAGCPAGIIEQARRPPASPPILLQCGLDAVWCGWAHAGGARSHRGSKQAAVAQEDEEERLLLLWRRWSVWPLGRAAGRWGVAAAVVAWRL